MLETVAEEDSVLMSIGQINNSDLAELNLIIEDLKQKKLPGACEIIETLGPFEKRTMYNFGQLKKRIRSNLLKILKLEKDSGSNNNKSEDSESESSDEDHDTKRQRVSNLKTV